MEETAVDTGDELEGDGIGPHLETKAFGSHRR